MLKKATLNINIPAYWIKAEQDGTNDVHEWLIFLHS